MHGSSGDTQEEAIQNVKNEIAWVANLLGKVVAQADESSQVNNFPKEEFLRGIDVIAPNEQVLLASVIVNSYRSGAETFLSAYALTSINSQSESRTTYLAEKSIVSMGDIKAKTESYSDNLRYLNSKGILTPKLFGVKDGSIYQEYITGAESASSVIDRLNKGEVTPDEAHSIIEQLAKAAKILDSEGYLVLGNFYHNFIYSKGLFYFIDGGFDLGSRGSSSSKQSLNTLLGSIKDVSLREYAESVYKA
ncbi:MAG: hypothetical protein QG639_1109 [Patescibacteria group bacterium]|nr:hypothetical protein [Patescibacteria group bacterium]